MREKAEKDDFGEFPISKVMPEYPLPTDIYLYIDKKFLKYKSAGDMIDVPKLNYFISKGIKNLFVLKADLEKMEVGCDEALSAEIEDAVAEVGEASRAIVEKKVELRHKLFDVFAEHELTTANVKLLQGMSKNFIEELTKQSDIAKLVEKLQGMSELAMDHALNVGNISIFIAMAHGRGDQDFLQNLFLASLLHDYGKLKIPANVLENIKSVAYANAIQDHPTKGAKYVRTIKTLPDIVATAVEQHHEQFNGRGYPKNLSGENINIMSRYLSVANVYDNALAENKNKTMDEAHKLAIKLIEYDRSKNFDPQMLPRIVDALKLAFGNYYSYK
ncbi:MAG: HD domain-containing protein [Bdellovibrio sp.]|nr:HD domain-containing protein [Bdellovibrio sp.]